MRDTLILLSVAAGMALAVLFWTTKPAAQCGDNLACWDYFEELRAETEESD